MTQTQHTDTPAYYTTQGTLPGSTGDWSLEAIEGDNAVLDARVSVSSVNELDAAIAALQALRGTLAEAEAFVGER